MFALLWSGAAMPWIVLFVNAMSFILGHGAFLTVERGAVAIVRGVVMGLVSMAADAISDDRTADSMTEHRIPTRTRRPAIN